MDNDFEIFKGKKFSDLCKDVYKNSANKREQIASLIEELRLFIKNPNDVPMYVPMIKEYLEASIKNDEQLIKLMAIVKKNNKQSADADNLLSEDEKKQLYQEAELIVQAQEKAAKEAKKIK